MLSNYVPNMCNAYDWISGQLRVFFMFFSHGFFYHRFETNKSYIWISLHLKKSRVQKRIYLLTIQITIGIKILTVRVQATYQLNYKLSILKYFHCTRTTDEPTSSIICLELFRGKAGGGKFKISLLILFLNSCLPLFICW